MKKSGAWVEVSPPVACDRCTLMPEARRLNELLSPVILHLHVTIALHGGCSGYSGNSDPHDCRITAGPLAAPDCFISQATSISMYDILALEYNRTAVHARAPSPHAAEL